MDELGSGRDRARRWSYTCDAAGNMTWDGFHHYSCDAEGKVLTVDTTGAQFSYGPFNEQVRVIAGSTDTVVLHNPFGNRVAEGNVTLGFTSQGLSYLGTRPAAYYTASPAATHFEHQDYLGTRSSLMAIAWKRFALPALDPLSSRDILNKKSGSIAR